MPVTTQPPFGDTSEAEEMYLITVAMAVEAGHEGPTPVRVLAEELGVSRVSANEMVKKLENRGFVTYAPYKGVELTDQGAAIARQVLRRRRLWSVFLAERLGMSPADADEVACEFEHVTPASVVHRLAEYLGDPAVGPEGRPIPSDDDTRPSSIERRLSELSVGQRARVLRADLGSAGHSFLVEQGIAEGAEVTLLAVGDDHACLVATPDGEAHLAARFADSVVVTPLP